MALNLQGGSTPNIDILVLTTCLGDHIDIRPQLSSFTIYEDMFFPCMTGEITVTDSIGLFDKLPIAGNETLTIRFFSWDYDPNNRAIDFIHRTFDILKITNVKQINDNTKTYTLHFASPELKINETIKISKSFPNTSISKVIENIFIGDYDSDIADPTGLGFPTIPLDVSQPPSLSQFLSSDNIETQLQQIDGLNAIELFVEKTKYIEPFITIPYSKPFEIIENLAARAIRLCGGRNDTTSSSVVSDFVFFENKRGFQFTSISSLLENKNNAWIFYSSNAAQNMGINGQRTVDRNRIEKFEIMDLHNVINNIHNGLYASRLLTYDMSTGEQYINDYNYAEEFPNTESTESNAGVKSFPMIFLDSNGENTLTNKSFSRYLFAPTIVRGLDFITTGTTQRVTDTKTLLGIEEYSQARMSQLARQNNIKVAIEIDGNSVLKTGDMIYLDLKYMPMFLGDAAVQAQKIKYYSGYYLITCIKHNVTLLEYKQVLELSKDSSTEVIGPIEALTNYPK